MYLSDGINCDCCNGLSAELSGKNMSRSYSTVGTKVNILKSSSGPLINIFKGIVTIGYMYHKCTDLSI